MKHTDTIALQGSIDDMRRRIATEQDAMHKVNLAVARWRGACPSREEAFVAGDDAPMATSQMRWHAEAQCHFMCWLEQGGFAQADMLSENQDAAPAPASAPSPITKETIAQAKQSLAPTLPAHCNDCAA
ncbi:hypothetical protein [Janthinobacterium sp. 1_2014MBL_MicDiv]|uniref:hypothetical protein n=1 Tax=Janthinobacterium sp. 1_2014MBL_MicDiv TaxID=1644131 RepID=UPI0008F51123|nr:hypothetical protein [Janthinobacterium sp. 1_2014MBL_MicDiv]